jgi:hypothetical protein
VNAPNILEGEGPKAENILQRGVDFFDGIEAANVLEG